MGDLLRQYWLPALPSRELPEADGEPKKVRLLGEDLVAFRDTDGAVGLMAAQLPAPRRLAVLRPQRGVRAALRLPRLEVRRHRQLRGHAQRARREHVQGQGAGRAPIPCHEVNGVVWAYMGPRQTPPPFPPFEITTLPADHVVPAAHDAGGVQLGAGARGRHRLRPHRLGARQGAPRQHASAAPGTATSARAWRCCATDYGACYSARRHSDVEGHLWHRITQFIAPCFTMIAAIRSPHRLGARLGAASTISTTCSSSCAAASTGR